MLLTFDDVLIKPRFSHVNSRKEISLKTKFKCGEELDFPIFSANMATVTGPEMSHAMALAGGTSVMHRFQTWGQLEKEVVTANQKSWWSFGLGNQEFERVDFLYSKGVRKFCLDVAHGAQIQVATMSKEIKEKYPDIMLMVGNFATPESIEFFQQYSRKSADILKVGIGPGSMCTTRIKTGCGYPQLSAIMECSKTGYDIIADGGMKKPGDIAKALAAGAKAVMLGGMLAGTNEAPGDLIGYHKVFHGSAWKEGAIEKHCTSEGEKTLIPCKGPVKNILDDIEGGLRSALSYVGAFNLFDFYDYARFVEISSNTVYENGAHGKK